jgi:hypothetical protein
MTGTKSLGEFLTDRALTERIQSLMRGREIRCAVAFWTENGVDQLFPEEVPDGAKILVDINMGNTSPSALEKLGAPGNSYLRHSDRMHAKVFLSDAGLVVGSANATGGALGARNTEAGTFHPAGSPAWRQASEWFDECFSEAGTVGRDQLTLAKLLYRPEPAKNVPKLPRAGSLLDIVRIASDRFASVGFAFSGTVATPEEKKGVRSAVLASGQHEADVINDLKDDNTFHNWNRDDIRRWPEYFFSFWQPAGKLYVSGHRWVAKDIKSGSLMTKRDLRGVKTMCRWKLPSPEEISRADQDLARSIRDGNEGVFFANGAELEGRLAELA